MSEAYDQSEQAEILNVFCEMLAGPTQDGGKKRKAGEKVSWKVDTGHKRAKYSHLLKYERGDTQDEDSGVDPLIHLAWRALALAAQRKDAEQERYEERYEERDSSDIMSDLSSYYEGYH